MVVLVSMLAACGVEPPVEQAQSIVHTPMGMATEEYLAVETTEAEPDLCGLAEALPEEDLCSLICDPVALEEAMLALGTPTGRCYSMVCPLSDAVTAYVGVCLF